MADPVFEFKIEGLEDIQRKLEELPHKASAKILRRALKAGGELIRVAMVAFAPKDTGWLAEHFGTRTKMIRQDVAGSIFIGPETKVDYPDKDGQYRKKVNSKGKEYKAGRISVASVARFFEYGTIKLPKRPFMTQAYEATKEAALTEVVKVIEEELKELTQ